MNIIEHLEISEMEQKWRSCCDKQQPWLVAVEEVQTNDLVSARTELIVG